MTTTRKTTMAAKATASSKKGATPPAAASAASPKGESAAKSMNRQDLIAAVAEEADLPKAKAGQVIDAVFSAIETALKGKNEVRLTGFGTFSVSTRKATTGRNPRTGESISIPESLQVRFKAGKGLKAGVG